MYASLNIRKNSKMSGKLVGTHQRFDKLALRTLNRLKPKRVKFLTQKDILHFEGSNGPDGIKRKSPGVDEPQYFIDPENDDGELFALISGHQKNLKKALKDNNKTRAAFEAAWLSHAIVDGLTPAHHYPYIDEVEDLMAGKDFVKLFGSEIKGIMRGDTLIEFLKHNWLYWGAGGLMSKHVGYEYGVALAIATSTARSISPKLTAKDLENIDLKKEFYATLNRINKKKIYDRFLKQGWTTDLAIETQKFLAPEIIRIVVLAWGSALEF
jgi:hypothetical protein